jgi:hypothetical protein
VGLGVIVVKSLGEYARLIPAAAAGGPLPVLDPGPRALNVLRDGLGLEVRDHSNGGGAPPGPARPDAACRNGAGSGDGRPGAPVVFAVDGPWAPPAQLLAALRGARFVLARDATAMLAAAAEALGDRADADRPASLTFAASPRELDARVLLETARLCGLEDRARPWTAVPHGFLTARDPAAASALVVRAAAYSARRPPRDVVLLRTELRDLGSEAAGLTVATKPQASLDRLNQAWAAGPVGILSFVGHARDDVLYITGGGICGMAPALCDAGPRAAQAAGAGAAAAAAASAAGDSAPGDAADAHLPCCAYGTPCYRAGESVPAWDVRAACVFLNSCMTCKLDRAIFDLDYTLTAAFLDGWSAAVVGSPLMTDGREFQSILFTHLVRAGLSVGEATLKTNQATAQTGIDIPSMVLLGDPELRLPTAAAAAAAASPRVVSLPGASPPVAAPPVAPAAIPRAADIAVGEGPLVTATIADAGLAGLLAAGDLKFSGRCGDGKGAPVYCIVSPAAPDAVEIRALTWTRFRDPVLRVRLEGGAHAEREAWRRTAAAIDELAKLGRININAPKFKSLLAEAESSATAFASSLHGFEYDIDCQAAARRQAGRLFELVGRAQELVLDHLLAVTRARVYHFAEAYRGGMVMTGRDVHGERCPYCGDLVYVYRLDHAVFGGLRRTCYMCSTCGVYLDQQAGGAAPPLALRFFGPDRARPGQALEQRLVVAAPGAGPVAGPVAGVVGMCVADEARHGVQCRPDRGAFALPGGGEAAHGDEAAFEFTVSFPDGVSPHHYWLRAYAVAGGAVYCASRNLWVAPPEGALGGGAG